MPGCSQECLRRITSGDRGIHQEALQRGHFVLKLCPCRPCQVRLELVPGCQLVYGCGCSLHAGSGLEAKLHPQLDLSQL